MKNDLMILDENSKKIYCTLDLESDDNKDLLFNSLQNCEFMVKDKKDIEIEMTDCYIEAYDKAEKDENNNFVINEVTGEVKTKKKYRTIIFDKDGHSYATGSYGIYNSLKMYLNVYGAPSKEHPAKIKFTERKIDNKKSSLIIVKI